MQLSQSAAGPARLSGKATYALIRPTVTEHASGGSAASAYHCASIPVGNCSLNADMTVPDGSDVSVSTSGGNIKGTAITATRLSATTGGGDVEIDFTQVPVTSR
jgi:hypothetical protein